MMQSRYKNRFWIQGKVVKAIESPAKGSKPASAVILVQYGPSREPTGKEVEFVNAVLCRIPSYKYGKIAEQCKVGYEVDLEGHMQGVVKDAFGGNRVYVELVADRLTFFKPSNSGDFDSEGSASKKQDSDNG